MMSVHRRATMCLAVLVTSLPLSACRTWRPQYLETSTQLVKYRKPVRLTLEDGSRVTLASARISGDSVHGTLRMRTSDAQPSFVSLPMQKVRKVEERQFSTGRTIGAVIATMGGLMVTALIGLASSDPWM